MRKKTTKKIISRFIVLVFVVFIFGMSVSVQAVTETRMSDLYSNPNQGGNNAYKFKISDVVNSNILSNVVGCTGVVNKVSKWMATMVQSPAQVLEMTQEAIQKFKNLKKQACLIGKAATKIAGNSIPLTGGVGEGLADVLEATDVVTAAVTGVGGTIGVKSLGSSVDTKTLAVGSPNSTAPSGAAAQEKACMDNVNTMNDTQAKAEMKAEEATRARDFKEQCFDGIAMTLARNQLTAMTRSAMNWVNTGYGGNPFFVRNIASFTQNIENGIVQRELSKYGDANYYPYSRGFSTAYLLLYQNKGDFADTMKYTLNNYLSSGGLGNDLGNVATRSYENNFADGGWNGWLAFTQQPQNNPLGFTALTSQRIADQTVFEIQNKKDELIQNGGFLSQQKCVEYNKPTTVENYYDANGKQKMREIPAPDSKKTCIKYQTITPGSIIKDKTTNYLNSPERQLELARTINDSLNALFSVLISKLEDGGLSGLSDSTQNTSNWKDNLNNFISSDGNSTYDNGGVYDGFNLTRDLGNTYMHDSTKTIGEWNAKDNKIITTTNADGVQLTTEKYLLNKKTDSEEDRKSIKRLLPDFNPKISNDQEVEIPNTNSYYTVKIAGKTKLINEGYNGWEVGDRAFWNGSEWQNWKCQIDKNTKKCTYRISPIKKRGVIQIQQDYIVAANEIVGVLPNIMTNLGELDYCLPGPNPSYQINSSEAQSAYQSWVGSMYVGPRDANRDEWKIDHEDSLTYQNLESIFSDNDNPNTWDAISKSTSMWLLHNFGDPGEGNGQVLDNGKGKTWVGKLWKWVKKNNLTPEGSDCSLGADGCQNYHYHKDGKSISDDGEKDVDNRKALMEKSLDFVNNHLFQDFYAKFDEQMNKLYFKNMTTKYIDTEISIEKDLNPAYVEMAESGFDLTKNIIYYNDDIRNATKEYVDAIAQAKINIAKLNPIKSEVSGIIKDAQDRRDTNLIKQINEEAIRTNRKDAKGNAYVLTPAEYNKEYASCLTEENIQVFDPEDITKRGSVIEENCSDGIDNDLNGLVDNKDPKCPGYVAPINRAGTGVSGSGARR